MGIPNLSRDLEPYQEEIILGKGNIESKATSIQSIVIDGPALVYFLYYRLLSSKDSRTLHALDAQPSYQQICQAATTFLVALQGNEVGVEKIYFDGGLPVVKQATRLERMERSRQRLENFCKTCPSIVTRPDMQFETIEAAVTQVFSEARRCPARFLGLPEPPFMVPAVIEHLQSETRNDAFQGLVAVVPGEADLYCASHARETGASILSNDSDLLIYDLGRRPYLVLLNTLDISPVQGDLTVISCSALRPYTIAQRLGLPDLVGLGFERFEDASASFNLIKKRAKQPQMNTRRRLDFARFRLAYSIGEAVHSDVTLVPFDTRLSELYHQFIQPSTSGHATESASIYLPVVVENHLRTSSWTFGVSQRTLAYSIFGSLETSRSKYREVGEYVRSGARIVSKTRNMYGEDEMRTALTESIELIQKTKALRGDMDISSALLWKLVGVHVVCVDLDAAGKALPDKEWMVKFLQHGYVDNRLTLDAVHVEANINAALYSLRVLKQVASFAHGRINPDLAVATLLDVISQAFNDMPPLTELLGTRLEVASNGPVTFPVIQKAVSAIYDEIESMPG